MSDSTNFQSLKKIALEQVGVGQGADVAANRLQGDAQGLGQVFDAEVVVVAEQFQQVGVSGVEVHLIRNEHKG